MWVYDIATYEEACRIVDAWDSMRYTRNCFYCGRKTTRPKPGSRFKSPKVTKLTATQDHVYPKCLGGRKTVVCCSECNGLKGDLTLEEFRTFVSGKGSLYFYFEKRMENKLGT